MKYYSEKLKQVFDTAEACQEAEFKAKEQENRERVQRERDERIRKEEQAKAAAERKEMAEKVDAARKEMVAAQKKYNEALSAFIDKYHTYHFSSSSIEDIPVLFDVLNPFKLL